MARALRQEIQLKVKLLRSAYLSRSNHAGRLTSCKAKAIFDAFYGPGTNSGCPLHVGSIKTVLGHLEGAAGIAGLIKACLAVQNSTIVPNLHFQNLSPAIEQYSNQLRVSTTLREWPDLPPNVPRRISVNSFGFGGTNAHAIVESYHSSHFTAAQNSLITPLTFSAKSESALGMNLRAVGDYLSKYPDASIEAVARTLQKRTVFQYRKVILGPSLDLVLEEIDEQIGIDTAAGSPTADVSQLKLLGVFTGQGAQYAQAGKSMIERSAQARQTLEDLQNSLYALPDAPSWSMEREIMKDENESRLGEALVSQPTSTAIQIILADHLKAAGVEFDVVVGHSSGEIAAAYAAGYISATDAIRISYYRGLYAGLARGNGKLGAMMAVSMSYAEATELCDQNHWEGRVSVAASNAPSSSTVSGDSDAIDEMKQVLDSQGIFARKLHVDTAYHSHHMIPCATPYLASLDDTGACGISSSSTCVWISSVHPNGMPFSADRLDNQYWVDNMTRPVLFAQALNLAAELHGPFGVALEVGPHPALQTPVIESLLASMESQDSSKVAYCGTFRRGQDSMKAFASAIGFLWENRGPVGVNFDSYRQACFGRSEVQPQILPSVPTYQWNHQHVFCREPRLSKQFLTEPTRSYDRLGTQESRDFENTVRFRNVLSLKSLPWLEGHKIQGQAVLPAMWYAAAILETVDGLGHVDEVSIVEVVEFTITKAVVLEESALIEILFEIRVQEVLDNTACFHIGCSAGPLYDSLKLDHTFSADVIVHKDSKVGTLTPCTSTEEEALAIVEADKFYDTMRSIGLEYSELFRGLESIHQGKGCSMTHAFAEQRSLVSHPASLDLALQSLLAASTELQGDLKPLLYVPQSIERILFTSAAFQGTSHAPVLFKSFIAKQSYSGLVGDVEMILSKSIVAQFQGVSWRPLTQLNPTDDRNLFAKTIWESDIYDGAQIRVPEYGPAELELVSSCDRVIWYYYRQLKATITLEELNKAEWHFHRLWNFIGHVLPDLEAGRYCTVKPEWLHDSQDTITSILEAHPDSADLQLIHAVGTKLSTALKERRSMLEFMMADQRLNTYYREGLGYERCYSILRTIVSRIAHRYPRMEVLEVGAGTGGASHHALSALAGNCSSYVFTDVSSGFFEKAQERFTSLAHRISFKILDLERDPLEQGYPEHAYDLIIGSLVIHATKDVLKTLGFLRSLLKPGGFVVLVEGSMDTLRSGFMMAGLPGWWLGGEDRRWGPMLGPDRWNTLLLEAGFSGIDIIHKDSSISNHNLGYVFLSQATESSLQVMHKPFSQMLEPLEQFAVLGGSSMRPERDNVATLLRPKFAEDLVIDNLEDIQQSHLQMGAALLCLFEYEAPIFECLNETRLHGLQYAISKAERILFVTQADNPYTNILIGLLRSLRLEIPHLKIQVLAIRGDALDATVIAETFLKLAYFPSSDSNILWTLEPELEWSNGALYLPRVVLDRERNNRLNSCKRQITQEVNPSLVPVKVVRDGRGSQSLVRVKGSIHRRIPSSSIHYSSLEPVVCGGRRLFPCIGTTSNGSRVLALAPELCSLISTDQLQCVLQVGLNVGPEHLHLLHYETIADTVRCLFASNIVVHNASDALRSALQSQPQNSQYLQFSYTNHRSGHELRISPFMSSNQIRHTLADAQVLVDCGSNEMGEVLKRYCPEVAYLNASTLASCKSFSRMDELLLSLVSNPSVQTLVEDPILRSGQLPTAANLHEATILDWTETKDTQLDVLDVSETFQLFDSGKTYLLAGLTGSMGRSLCEWMISQGARNVVLTSRNPVVEQRWLDRQKATVWIRPLDICNVEALRSLVQEIEAKLPRIAGVVNGAMVLEDGSFLEMSFDAMCRSLAPKVNGTCNLDEVFDTPLDFFIMLSSIAWVVGNPGQSNYSAANGFMDGVAKARRRRGLAASTMSIGVVSKVGYLARTKGGYESDHAKRRNVMTITEQELHTIFAEAIIAGRSEHTEIIAGLDGVIDGSIPDVSWLSDPRVSQLIVSTEDQTGGVTQTMSKVDTAPLKQQIVGNYAESFDAIVKAFCAKLKRILMLDQILEQSSLVDLGVDSLLAVEIRSFFLTELRINIPILKILSGATVKDIANLVLEELETPETTRTNTSRAFTPSSENNDSLVAPMTFAQTRMFRINEFTKAPRVNNLSWAYRIEGNVNVDRLKQAFAAAVQNHEILRTRFSGTTQEVMLSPTVDLQIKAGDVDAEFDRINNTEFDLGTGYLMAAVLVQSVFMCSFHHIVIDVNSIELFLKDIDLGYRGEVLTPVEKTPAEFANYEQKAFGDGVWAKSITYWKQQHDTGTAVLPLFPGCLEAERQPLLEYRLRSVRKDLTQNETFAIKMVADDLKVSSYHFYLSILRLLLDNLLHLDNICIGAVDAGRASHPEFANVFGPMFNYLPLRFRNASNLTLPELCRDTRSICYAGAGHAQVPFDVILSELGIEHMPTTHHPLYQVQINYLQHHLAEVQLGDLTLKERNASGVNVSYDFCVSVLEYPGGGGRVIFEIQETLYGNKTLQWLAETYVGLMEEFLQAWKERPKES